MSELTHRGATKSGRRADESAATRLAKLVHEYDTELFHAEERAFATFSVNGHRETAAVGSRAFRSWVTQLAYRAERRVPPAQTVQDTLRALEGAARYEGREEAVAVRVAGSGDAIYLDLGTSAWDAVEITAAGWVVVERSPVRFIRPRGMLPLPRPVGGGTINDLRPFVNVDGEQAFRLLVSWLVSALRPRGPYPVLQIGGEAGSAKSTTAKVVKGLTDPTRAPLRGDPRDVRDLMITAQNCWVPCFSNLSGLPRWLSDGLCRLSTGGGLATRELYSDSEETLIDVMRPTVVEGIPDLASADDLVERIVTLTLPRIDDEGRRPEDVFWADFERARPRILGALLNGVATALKNRAGVRLARTPRMGDFAVWVTAAGPAFGWQPDDFMAAYDRNAAEAAMATLDTSLLAAVVLELVAAESWYGTPGGTLDRLTGIAGDRVRDRGRQWPKSPGGLGKGLRRIAPALRKAGVVVDYGREDGGGRPRYIRLERRDGSGTGHQREKPQ